MASNDVIILDQILSQKRQELAPDLSENEYFEIFTAEQILKDYELSYDELKSGITGNGGDGGIDSLYVFINGELLQEDTDLLSIKKEIVIELLILQSKTSKGFSETVIEKFIDVTENLLDLSNPIEDYETVYNKELRDAIGNFRGAYETLAARFPKLIINYYYASKGSTEHPNLKKKVDKLKAKVKQLFSSAEVSLDFFGASKLLEKARRSPQKTYSLKLVENPISSSDKVGFLCLVSLRDYVRFITDEDENLRKHIFEANVRDYQGKTLVNEQIQQSLRASRDEDFWWLNNGVSVLASHATLSGKTLTIENPEIVNGLQTSAEIFKYFKEVNPANEARNLVVRVIVPDETESRDRIIKATNSQTTIPPASLRATEKIHRDIEEFLRPYGLYYDRRKNYYKNEGKPINKIISIPYLSQTVMSVLIQRPDHARARPSSLLTRDEDYEQLFNPSYPIKIYYVCLMLVQRVEQFLKTNEFSMLDRKTRGDVRFHIATHISISLLAKDKPSVGDLSEINVRDINDAVFSNSTTRVMAIYRSQTTANPIASDKVAKSPEFREAIKNDAKSLHRLL